MFSSSSPYRTAVVLIMAFAVSSCSAGLSSLYPTSIPSPSPTETGTATAVVQWFPATNTPTLLPSSTPPPIENMYPSFGELLFADSFDQPEFWNTTTSTHASAAVARNRLSLSVSGQKPLLLFSLRREPVVDDFYAEATASLSLCGDQDKYGVVFRAADGNNYYRFALACDGQMRLERILSGTAFPLSDWLPSGDVPMGAPAVVKIGVWAMREEMRFFLNDRYQFTRRDRSLSRGTLGFFAYTNGSMPITVAFSELAVYSVSSVSPISSQTPSATP